MPFLDNEESNIFYEVYGNQGEWVLLVNGYTRPASDFRALAKFLAGKGYQVLVFDNRGAGETKFKQFQSLVDIADDINSLMVHLRIESVSIVGFSMGGIVGRIFCHRYPSKVMRLCLVSSPCDSTFYKEREGAVWGETLEEVESKMSKYVTASFFQKNQILMKAMAKGIYDKLKSGFSQSSLSQSLAIKSTPEHFYEISSFSCPVLIVHGLEDEIVPSHHAEKLASSNPLVNLILMKDVGHLPLIEAPQKLYKLIESFLAGS